MPDVEKQKWEQWNEYGGPSYPHDKVVQFMFRNFSKADRPQTKVLDLGCGTGVHTVFLSREGFKVFGSDISDTGIKATHEKLKLANLKAEDLKTESISTISHPDNFFDCLICVGVFDAAGKTETTKAIAEIYRVLKNGGKGFFVFATNEDFRTKDKVWPLYGYEYSEIKEMLSFLPFEKTWIDTYSTSYENQKYYQKDFLITVFK